MPRHSYDSAEKFLLSREFFGMKLGLENITEFLESIGSPQNNYKTIHIAGTNGKGSTAVMLASILQKQGYKTGLFTSPHLISLRERVSINGRKIPKASVISYVDRYRKILSKRKLSFFEVITAMALYYFDRINVDVAVIETGLGGRLDASNVLQPEITITTDISKDHMEILGSSLSKIAYEKAGIIKPGVPHLIGMLPESARNVMVKRCKTKKAPMHILKKNEFKTYVTENKLDFISNGYSIKNIQPQMYGSHQLRNSALVIKAASILNENGLKITKKAIRDGLAEAVWPGRFQVIERKTKPSLVFDVCHNTGGVTAFVESFKNRFPGKKVHLITGVVKRKEHQKMFDLLGQLTESFYLVPLATHRSSDIDELIGSINWRGNTVIRHKSLHTAYKKVLRLCEKGDIIIVIGSHFLVGEFFNKKLAYE